MTAQRYCLMIQFNLQLRSCLDEVILMTLWGHHAFIRILHTLSCVKAILTVAKLMRKVLGLNFIINIFCSKPKSGEARPGKLNTHCYELWSQDMNENCECVLWYTVAVEWGGTFLEVLSLEECKDHCLRIVHHSLLPWIYIQEYQLNGHPIMRK